MNGYIFLKSFRMLSCHWKIHLSVMLQIAAGIGVIYASATIYLSILFQYEKMKLDAKNMVWNIIVSAERITGKPPLDYAQYTRLKEEYPQATFPFYIIHRLYYSKDGNGIHTAYFLYASDDFIRSVLHVNGAGFETGNIAYVGEEIEALLQDKYKRIKQDMPSSMIREGRLSIGGRITIPVAPLTELRIGMPHLNLEDAENVPFNNIALLPLSSYYKIFDRKDIGSFRLSILLNQEIHGEKVPSLVMDVMDKLLLWNGADYSYSVRTELQHFLLQIGQVRDAAVLAAVIAGLSMVIVIIGLTGLVQLLFHRRKTGLAVSSALGADKKTLFTELFLEATLPSLIGGIIGTIGCSYYLSAYIRFEAFELRQSVAVMALTITLSLLPGLISSGSLIFRIRRLRPLEILRRE